MTPAAPPTSPVNPGLYRFAVGVVLAVFVLIKVGAMVTSTGSGMAFTDWPLSNGSLWPPNMRPDELLEHGHRAVGLVIGMLSIALAVWILRVDRRPWLRDCAIALVLIVTLQGVIGGVRVVKDALIGVPSAIVHGVLAQLILCMFTFLAFALSPAWQVRAAVPSESAATVRRMAMLGLVAVFIQLVLGAIARHVKELQYVWIHVAMAFVVSLLVLLAAIYAAGRVGVAAGFQRLSNAMMGLLLLQIVLGFATLALRHPSKEPSNIEHIGKSLMASFHVLCGAALFLSSALLVYKAWRNLVVESRT